MSNLNLQIAEDYHKSMMSLFPKEIKQTSNYMIPRRRLQV